jgi:hypothetical protein
MLVQIQLLQLCRGSLKAKQPDKGKMEAHILSPAPNYTTCAVNLMGKVPISKIAKCRFDSGTARPQLFYRMN